MKTKGAKDKQPRKPRASRGQTIPLTYRCSKPVADALLNVKPSGYAKSINDYINTIVIAQLRKDGLLK